MPSLGMTSFAQVTMNKLIRDDHALVPALRDLGFAAVAFSYPQRARLGSTTMAWSEDSSLVNFTDGQLARACIADCYRDSSAMLHFAVSLGDALHELRNGRPIAAFKALADRRNLTSLGAVIENAGVLSHLAKVGRGRKEMGVASEVISAAGRRNNNKD
ncbi:MAG TPA: hypothetical protein VKV17_10730 [Bryobacteraceae bacterium]|nr:hypothetical protein [Bryobacteraceae bacterium]